MNYALRNLNVLRVINIKRFDTKFLGNQWRVLVWFRLQDKENIITSKNKLQNYSSEQNEKCFKNLFLPDLHMCTHILNTDIRSYMRASLLKYQLCISFFSLFYRVMWVRLKTASPMSYMWQKQSHTCSV